jgi:ribonucleoside-diphosphate reductase alpha chain
MQWSNQTAAGQSSSVPPAASQLHPGGLASARVEYSDFKVIRRNGAVVGFEPAKISIAMTKAFLAVNGGQGAASARIREVVEQLTQGVVGSLMRRMPSGGTVHIEDIQDHVELALMRAGEHEVARSYVLYRERRAQERAQSRKQSDAAQAPQLHVIENGARVPFDAARIRALIEGSCDGLNEFVNPDVIVSETIKNLYDGVPIEEVHKSAILAARSQLENDPAYSRVTARLLLHTVRREVLNEEVDQAAMQARYADYFPKFIKRGIDVELLDERLAQYDLARLGAALDARRDLQFDYIGLQTLYDRYFLVDRNDGFSKDGRRIELPQAFFMRVAMGLALNEIDREARAVEFYEILSRFDFMSSTPTLFNAGTRHSQLSSCYLTTVSDDLDGIYESIKENALLAKYAGGLGNDWTPVRAMGSHIKGTNGESQGVVPFLKVVNDTAVAVNQCFAPETEVFTSLGARPIRDIRAGDLVLTEHGNYREVTEHLTYNQADPMIALDVTHGLEPMRVTAGHPIFGLRGLGSDLSLDEAAARLARGTVRPGWVDAGDLSRGDYVAFVIPTEVVPAGLTDEDARLYGVLLAAGELNAAGTQWSIVGKRSSDAHFGFVENYLAARGVPFWAERAGADDLQICFAAGRAGLREGTSGQFVSEGPGAVPFARADLFDALGNKWIAPRLAHLPRAQTLSLLQGLVEAGGQVARDGVIRWRTASRPLAQGVRYQMLRLRAPVAGRYCEPDGPLGAAQGGAPVRATVRAFDLCMPAIAPLAERLGCVALERRDWIEFQGAVYSPVRQVEAIAPVPFVFDLKVEGTPSYLTSSGLAHNGGKRKGAVCCYLESWHLDIEEFLELRKNTGDDRRRTHDMNTANWIPDLFMKRVMDNAEWTLFSPSSVPDLHDKVGRAFEEAYLRYEDKAARGELKPAKKIQATTLWRKMLSMLFETGHPWITFKDPCNIRSPQQHTGVVHSSNLCTEITLNTNDSEIAVCNLGSVNLVAHMARQADGRFALDHAKLQATIRTAMRMLDNVIDINYYAVKKARDSNLRHRPVGLGIMGFQDCLHVLRLPYASEGAVEFADRSMEAVCYFAYWASTELAEERGRYSSYRGSLWDRNILPQDTLKLLAEERGGYVEVDASESMDWDALRARIAQFGMRNSNCVAIAPTATISNIIGVSACIEPTFENLYVKSNLSGEFTIVNDYLVRDLKKLGLWDEVMVADLKFFDGSLAKIDRVPPEFRQIYATAFEVEPKWLVEAASRRQKWIDQAQSLNIYMAGASGKKLDDTYKLAWLRGLKTTYYLRTLSASSAEKSTGRGGELNAVPVDGGLGGRSAAPPQALPEPEVLGQVCMLKPGDDGYEECEACQ